jgi:two-component system NarL family sensor kinase
MFYNWFAYNETQVITSVIIGVSLLMVIIIVMLLIVFVRKKNTMVEEKRAASILFNQELAQSQIAIREETLRNISWELHDNIGQLLTLAKIKAQSLKEQPEHLDEVVETIGTGLNELRALSKSINPDILKTLSLSGAVEQEVLRFNRLEFLDANLKIEGETYSLGPKIEIILFRILQEFFSNTIKHARATTLDITLDFTSNLKIIAKDNGIGFTRDKDYNGMGLNTMKNRARLVGADLNMTSKAGQGTMLHINLMNSNKNELNV